MNPRGIRQIGPYPVIEFLAEGGMAWVFKVEDPRFRVHRALKMLKPAAAQGEEFRRFESEAKLLAHLDHPSLITIYDFGRDESTDCHYYTMTFVDGSLLSHTRPLPPDRAIPIFLDVLSALERLHLQGIVHRDVKPGNILMTSDGRVLLGDLGIARHQDQMISLTRTGMAIGSVQYMSPEQARGEPVSASSDVFSVGLVLYQVLTGHTIYDAADEVDGSSGEQVLMYLGALIHSGGELRFRFPRSVPPPIRRVIEKACRFDPEQRYANAGAMRLALLEAYHAAPPESSARRPGLVAAGVALAAAAGLAVWLLPGLLADPPPAAPVPAAPREVADVYEQATRRLQQPETSVAQRRALVAEIGGDPSPAATAVLRTSSRDPSAMVAVDAVKLLSARMDPAVAEHLIGLLSSEEFTVRAWAARGLGEAGWEPARPALEARLALEPEGPVATQIRKALARIDARDGGAE